MIASWLEPIQLRTNVRGKDDHAQLHALMKYRGHLIDQCEDILALWIYDELTKSQVVRRTEARMSHALVTRRLNKPMPAVSTKAVCSTATDLTCTKTSERANVN